jgi:hypothetical protein
MSDELEMWTIFDHPRDRPDHFVARKFIISREGPLLTDEVLLADEVDALREAMEYMGKVKLMRSPEDDPVIMETWV